MALPKLTRPSFSFRCDGNDSAGLLAGWKHTSSEETDAAGKLVHEEYVDPATGPAATAHVAVVSRFRRTMNEVEEGIL